MHLQHFIILYGVSILQLIRLHLVRHHRFTDLEIQGAHIFFAPDLDDKIGEYNFVIFGPPVKGVDVSVELPRVQVRLRY